MWWGGGGKGWRGVRAERREGEREKVFYLPVSVCLSVCLPASVSVCLSVCMSVFLSVCLSLIDYEYISSVICNCRSLSVFLCLSVSVCLSVCLSLPPPPPPSHHPTSTVPRVISVICSLFGRSFRSIHRVTGDLQSVAIERSFRHRRDSFIAGVNFQSSKPLIAPASIYLERNNSSPGLGVLL